MVLTVELPRGQYRAKTSKSPYISGGDNTKDIPNYEGIYAITEDGRLFRNYRTCKLYYKDKLIKTFGSVSSACRYYQTEFNGSYSSLAKYRKIGDFEVRCND